MNEHHSQEADDPVEQNEPALWAAPRGLKTKALAWIIIILFALSMMAMLIVVITGVG